MGAGWHEGEHEEFGIPLPPIGERISRLESAVSVLHALFSPEAQTPPGVTLGDRFYPLRGATNDPGPVRPGGPPIWLGGQKPRGIALAARAADGWLTPGNRAGDIAYFVDRRDALLRSFEAIGRDPSGFQFAGQVICGADQAQRREALEAALSLVRAGATHMILGLPAAAGPEPLRAAAKDSRSCREMISEIRLPDRARDRAIAVPNRPGPTIAIDGRFTARSIAGETHRRRFSAFATAPLYCWHAQIEVRI